MKLSFDDIERLGEEYEEQQCEFEFAEQEGWYLEALHENAGDRD